MIYEKNINTCEFSFRDRSKKEKKENKENIEIVFICILLLLIIISIYIIRTKEILCFPYTI